MSSSEINEQKLRQALQVLKPDNQLFEIRILKNKKTFSGYFRSADVAVEQLEKFDLRGANVFFTLNKIEPACYSRSQSDKLTLPENTTSDGDIVGYDWLLVDLDPVRPSGISSTTDELDNAKALSKKVFLYLKGAGFNDPVISVSGNGVHLLYKIRLKNAPESVELVKRCLGALDLLFSDSRVKVDTANFNPSRICKLYGTLAQKGKGTEDRPHRMSYIASAPENIKPTDKAYLEKLAEVLPVQTPAPARYNGYNPKQFDIETWMSEHGLRWQTKKEASSYTKYILTECPFDSNHKAPDSCITVGTSGAIGFHCFHDHCQGKTWKDVRLLFEPRAYEENEDDKRIEDGWKQHREVTKERQQPVADVPDQEEQVPAMPMFKTAMMILDRPEPEETFIRTGFLGIDNRLRGLAKKRISLLSGLRGGSKSTLLSQIALQALTDGQKVIMFSGELDDKEVMKWIFLQAAGKMYVKQDPRWNNYYYVPRDVQRQIAEWMAGNYLLYENNYGNRFSEFYKVLRRKVIEQGTDLVVLDNLMMLNIRDLSPDKYEAQKVFVESLKNLATETMCHIIFVAHPRKSVGFLRLDDVSGSADMMNLVDYAFIVHRNNEDFHRMTAEMFKWKLDNPIYKATNVIEIVKDRAGGNQDVFVPLWYEPETKRLKNAEAECVKYGWQPEFKYLDPEEQTIFDEEM